jgi:hypothetical protein
MECQGYLLEGGEVAVMVEVRVVKVVVVEAVMVEMMVVREVVVMAGEVVVKEEEEVEG